MARKKAVRKAARKKAVRKKVSRKKVSRKKVSRKAVPRKAAGKATVRKKAAPKKATRKRVPTDVPVFPEVEALVDLMHRHHLLELDYKLAADGTKEIRISRTGSGLAPAPAPAPAARMADAGPAPEAAPPSTPAVDENLHAFKSPMVGTFYRAPSPEAPAFINVGDRVEEANSLCIIEAMKVMNEITADVGGEIVSIEVENGEAVEFGQTLFLIRPN